ncbi:MAG TPA: hypothetical protein PK280_19230 [Planctomycetota bacterium]|nr:hypothetical protein [Planctomycetota bacterium]
METTAAPAPDRSRRVYVWWGVAFAFLALLGLCCLLVIGPVVEVHSVLKRREAHSRLTERAKAEPTIIALGGPEQAAHKLDRYLRMPAWVLQRLDRYDPGEADTAATLLGHCGKPGLRRIIALLESSDPRLQHCGEAGVEGFLEGPYPFWGAWSTTTLRERALEGVDPETRRLADQAIHSLEDLMYAEIEKQAGRAKW